MKKFCSVLLLMLLMGFVLISPAMIISGLNKNVFIIKEEKQRNMYKGMIELWHIVSFKTGKGSGYSELKRCGERFEKNEPYVFVNVEGMTVEEAEQRLKKGQKPDVVSYPKGYFDETGFISINNIGDICQRFNVTKSNGVPYMFDSYVLLVNCDVLLEQGFFMPVGEKMPEDLFVSLAPPADKSSVETENYSLVYSDTTGKNYEKIMDHLVLSDETVVNETRKTCEEITYGFGTELFLNKRASMLICPYSEYRSILNNSDIKIAGYYISEYTDLIQCIGVYANDDKAKEEMCVRFADMLLGSAFQNRLESIEMFPVIENDDIYKDDFLRKNEYVDFMRKGVFYY